MSDPRDYGPDSIEVLEGIDAVRRRPGMYVGDVHDGSGLHHLVWELVANAVDEHLATWARHLHVEIGDGWLEVADDGRGIPVDVVPSHGVSALEVVFTTLHAGATWDGHTPHVHIASTLHGVGLAAVNALCARLQVDVHRRGTHHRALFAQGRVVEPLAEVGPTRSSGTHVRMWPDPAIFGSVEFDRAIVRSRLTELAWLHPFLDVQLDGVALPGRGGIAEWARTIAASGAPVFAVRTAVDHVHVDVAITWSDTIDSDVRTFVTAVPTERGTHLAGLFNALTRIARSITPDGRTRELRGRLAKGIVAILNVSMYDPRFGGPRRDQLVSPIAARAVRKAIAEAPPISRKTLEDAIRERLARTPS